MIPDEATKKQIADALTARYGASNVNFDNLRVNTSAKPFAAGWWDNFSRILPNLKDWSLENYAPAGANFSATSAVLEAAISSVSLISESLTSFSCSRL